MQTPTWLWLPPSYWRTYSTTIMVWGYVVTIFATPTTVRWKMGNGDSVTCIGPGTPWFPGFIDALSTCKYTYRHSSDGASGDRFRITATVTFVGSFTTVGLGGIARSVGRGHPQFLHPRPGGGDPGIGGVKALPRGSRP